MSLVIEKGIFPPPAAGMRSKWPWHEMEVGDSVLIPIDLGRNACSHVNQWAKRHGYKFVTRKQPGGGIRVWRVA